ncbi:uncharacterized protein [Ambystoma mexicanum]|uniref:uncharacterized protein isoform X2 n=1 Tax=Ambystoma mexicanum TaxID=8296 RepID=UPI0037E7355E
MPRGGLLLALLMSLTAMESAPTDSTSSHSGAPSSSPSTNEDSTSGHSSAPSSSPSTNEVAGSTPGLTRCCCNTGCPEVVSGDSPFISLSPTTDSALHQSNDTCPEGVFCLNKYYLIAGALGICVVSALLSCHITVCFFKVCQGKKKKETEGDDGEISLQYASLQNLATKDGSDAVGRTEEDAEKKTCYASVADLKSEVQAMDEQDTSGMDPQGNP